VKVTDVSGNVVAIATHADVLTNLVEQEGIESITFGGKRPSSSTCLKCKLPFQLGKRGRIPRLCIVCRFGTPFPCRGGCGALVRADSPTGLCRVCNGKLGHRANTVTTCTYCHGTGHNKRSCAKRCMN
jgi:hypothetical protein